MKKKFAEGGPVEEKTWLEQIGAKLAAKGAPIAYDVSDDTAAHEVDGSTNTAKPENDNGTLVGFRDTLKKASGYDDGGTVINPAPYLDSSDQAALLLSGGSTAPNLLGGSRASIGPNPMPSGSIGNAPPMSAPADNGPSFGDKLSAVMQAMGMGAKAAVAPLMPPPSAPTTPTPAAINPLGATLPASAPVPPQNGAPAAPQPPPSVPSPAPAAPAAPKEAPAVSATDLMSKLTDGDGAKMSALMAQLTDANKRNQFAQALAIIGDTFGNMGQAKAGQTPEGIKTPQMIQEMGEKNKASAIQNLTQSLAADPNSQTSKMAQATLMQSMGIKPGDPRAAKIQSMPAMAITQLVPQMTDAVKNNIEKEKNLIEAKKADLETSNQELTRQNMAATQARETRVGETNAANDTLKNTHLWNVGAREGAMNTLERNQGGGQGHPSVLTATNKMGHKIMSQDGGRTWKPAQ